jgi:hypothetical protein
MTYILVRTPLSAGSVILGSKGKLGLINISDMDWTTSKSNRSDQQTPGNSCSLNMIFRFAMILGLKMTDISSEEFRRVIF